MNQRIRELPTRPSIPPLFIAAVFSWLAILLIEDLTWKAHVGALDFASITSSALPVGLFMGLLLGIKRAHALRGAPHKQRHTLSTLAVISISCIAASCCALAFWMGWSANVAAVHSHAFAKDSIDIELTGDPVKREYGTVSSARINFNGQTMNMRLIWPDDSTPLFAGHRIFATGNMLDMQDDEGGRWAHQNGYVGTFKAAQVNEGGYASGLRGFVTPFRDDSFGRISHLGGDGASLLAGVLLGNKTLYASSELDLAFQTTGLAHLMAVSGTHLAIVTAILGILLGKTHARRRLRGALLITALIAYVALTGFAASALRACVMCASAIFVGLAKRRANALAALSLCVFVFLGISPPMAFSLGFLLSALSVLGLVIFGSLIQSWIKHLLPAFPDIIVTSFAATVAASFITLPATIPQFSQLPLASPLANLIAAPLVTVSLSIGLMGVLIGLICPPVGSLVLHLAGAAASLCAFVVRALADIPGACMPLSNSSMALAFLFTVMLIVLWVFWPLPPIKSSTSIARSPRKVIFAGTCACIAFAIPVALPILMGFGQLTPVVSSDQPRVVMLDIGQGDSMLVHCGSANILIDTGEDSDMLLRELAEQGVSHLDAVLISHKDNDHAGALRKLAGIVGVDHVYVHADLIGKDIMKSVLESARWVTAGAGAEGVRPGFCVKAGEFALTVISPQNGGTSENDDSLVCLLEFDADGDGNSKARGLLTGDAEKEALEGVTSKVGDIDFLKVAHHGSKGGLSEKQLEELSPEIALISVGADNRYGHPTAETLNMLKQAHAHIYRTDEQGAITMRFAKDGIAVETER